MINRNIAAFCAAFESELQSTNSIDSAIEIACSYDLANIDDYED